MPTPPARVAEFTRQHLETLDDLQVLVACMESPDRWWSAEAIADHVGLTPSVGRRRLDRLVRRNLFDIRVSDEVRYRFSPGTPALAETAAAWLAEYRKHPLPVVMQLTDHRGLRDFADAFRIKRDDDR
jgi:hypothetical protein